MKVIQIQPPESDEEHYSFDSKERHSNQLQQKNANMIISPEEKHESVKAFKVADTPMDDVMIFPEAPLQEEPMPEQKSFKNISPK